MKSEILSATDSAAYAAKAASVSSVPYFPAPLSVEIAKKLPSIHKCDIFELESAGAAFAAALGCAAAGRRVLVPASSPLGYEAFAAPFMRLPFVVVNIARSLHGIKSDHAAAMLLRDSGYLMFFPESNQEIYDTVIQAYRICEDQKVLLPAIVSIDGLPNFSEAVYPVTEQSVRGFLPKLKPKLDVKKPLRLDIYSGSHQDGKLQQSKAMENAVELLKKVDEQWKKKFHRSYGLVERFMTDDAETVIVIMGYHSSTARAAVRKMREAGKKVGLLRIRVFRPWPGNLVSSALANVKKVLVFEQAISVGVGGVLSAHIKRSASQLVCLGKYPSEKDFADAVARVEKSEKDLKLWL